MTEFENTRRGQSTSAGNYLITRDPLVILWRQRLTIFTVAALILISGLLKIFYTPPKFTISVPYISSNLIDGEFLNLIQKSSELPWVYDQKSFSLTSGDPQKNIDFYLRDLELASRKAKELWRELLKEKINIVEELDQKPLREGLIYLSELKIQVRWIDKIEPIIFSSVLKVSSRPNVGIALVILSVAGMILGSFVALVLDVCKNTRDKFNKVS